LDTGKGYILEGVRDQILDNEDHCILVQGYCTNAGAFEYQIHRFGHMTHILSNFPILHGLCKVKKKKLIANRKYTNGFHEENAKDE